MIEGLRRRGGLTDMRMALDQVAVIGEMLGEPGWNDLAVTALNLPVTNMFSLGDPSVAERAATSGRVLSLRDAHSLADRILTAASGAEPFQKKKKKTERPALLNQGESWAIRYAGSEVTVRASKGMLDLARLLAAPGVEFPAIDLMGASVTVEGSDEILDESARQSYKARILELQADIEDAEEFGDASQAKRARVEMDVLVDQLTSATGLGGRRRRTPTAADRARSAVTHRLRSTIRRIASLDPALGRHLERSISTGTFCAYCPDPPVEWHVDPPGRLTRAMPDG